MECMRGVKAATCMSVIQSHRLGKDLHIFRHQLECFSMRRQIRRSFSSENHKFLKQPLDSSEAEPSHSIRHPRALEALYLKPLGREAEYGVSPSCDLQIRSYSLQPLEFFADFALRAAYYLGLPAYGPIPLPRITERWTVPKSHFIFKKAQENFERVTLRRIIQIKDGHSETATMVGVSEKAPVLWRGHESQCVGVW